MSARRAGIVGPGRLGTLVAHALNAAGIAVTRVAGGSDVAREHLQSRLAGLRDVPVAEVADGVDLVVIATPDAVISEVVDTLVRDHALDESHGVIHLAGVHGLAPLRRAGLAGARIAALHPATTVPHGANDPSLLHGVAWAVTTVPGDRDWAHALVTQLGGDPFDVEEAARVRYHAALAVASNTVGAAVVTARRIMMSAGVAQPERLVGPIAHASVTTAATSGGAALTGPVVRGDVPTVTAHLAALERDLPELAASYRDLSRSVLRAVRPSLDPAVAEALETVLRGHDRSDRSDEAGHA